MSVSFKLQRIENYISYIYMGVSQSKCTCCTRDTCLPVMQLSINVYLPLSDITREIRSWMCDICNQMVETSIEMNQIADTSNNSNITNQIRVMVKKVLFWGGGSLPSLGIVKIGIWVIEPFLPSIRPARS